jgi:hypothetical protein
MLLSSTLQKHTEIFGFDEELNANVELMEYGYCGGSGGQGCLVIGYSDGARVGV